MTSCNNGSKQSNNLDDSDNNNEWAFKDVADNFKYVSEINITHRLSLSCDGEYLPVRKRPLNKSELIMSNSGTPQGNILNDSLILSYIYNGHPLELIDSTYDSYKIKFQSKNQALEGYIIKNYCQKRTITRHINITNSLQSSNLIKNPGLLPYCKVFVTEKFHILLNQGINSKNPLQHLKNILSQTQTELVLYALFVGQSERELYNNPHRMGSDMTHLIYCIKNDYYSYEFSNYGNMFVVTSPSLPVKIDTFSIKKDTLKFTTEDYDNYHSKKSIKLYPQENKRAFTSRKGTKWVLNDTIRLIDISYIADRLFVPETQIGHTYFYEILELYIQDILPKRNDTYLEHYLDQ